MSARQLTGLFMATLASAAFLTAGAASSATAEPVTSMRAASPADSPATCRGFVQGSREYYRNCTNTSERIWVTRRFGPNRHYCVPAWHTVDVGHHLDVYGIYHDGWNC